MCLVAIFTWTLTPSTGMCISRVWLLAIGSSCILGTTFSKTWRIARILSNDSLKPLIIPTTFLLKIFGLIVSIDVIILVVWTALSPLEAVVTVVDENRPTMSFISCSAPRPTAHVALLGIEIIYKGLLIIVSAVVAWKTRSVKLLLFSESKYIAFTIYNMLLCLVIIVPIQFSNVERNLEFVLRSIFILLIIGATMFFLLGTKLWLFWKNPALWDRKRGSSNQNTTEMTNTIASKRTSLSSSDSSSVDVKRMKERIEELETRLQSYESLRKRSIKLKKQLGRARAASVSAKSRSPRSPRGSSAAEITNGQQQQNDTPAPPEDPPTEAEVQVKEPSSNKRRKKRHEKEETNE